MSNPIDNIATTEGVTALVVLADTTHERGESSRILHLHYAIQFCRRTGMDTMHSADERRIVVRQHRGITFAVEHPVGHRVAKSLERMLRRAAKRIAPSFEPAPLAHGGA